MFSAKQLTEDQKTSLKQWAAEGASIADLQNRMKEEFQIGMTYMDARFMVLDLGIEIQTEPEEEPKADEATDVLETEPTGYVEVTMDSIPMAGALVSGKVIFSDGATAVWMLDQQGRPALDPDTPGYRPSEDDVMSFQKQLSELIQQKGM